MEPKQAFAYIHSVKMSSMEVVDVLRSYLEQGWVYLNHLDTYDGIVIIFEEANGRTNSPRTTTIKAR